MKNFILFVLIGVGLVAAYFLFLKPKQNQPNLVSTNSASGTVNTTTSGSNTSTSVAAQAKANENSELAKEFLNLLLSVRGINLDNSIFFDPAFIALRDSTIILVNDGTEGRPNPFAPIGSDGGGGFVVPTSGSDEQGSAPAPNLTGGTIPPKPATNTKR